MRNSFFPVFSLSHIILLLVLCFLCSLYGTVLDCEISSTSKS